MRGQSIQDVMRDVAAHVEAAPAPQPKLSKKQSLTELDAFVLMDPLLADLQKDFLDTKARYEELIRKNGQDDPMAQVAADMQDSAWCAMQTRYLELREQRILMRKAQRLMREHDLEEEKAEEKKRREKLTIWLQQLYALRKQQRKKSGISAFALLVFYLFVNSETYTQDQAYLPLHQRFAA